MLGIQVLPVHQRHMGTGRAALVRGWSSTAAAALSVATLAR